MHSVATIASQATQLVFSKLMSQDRQGVYDTNRLVRILGLALLTVLAAALLIQMHDRSSYLPDDGAYAYVASRLLHGDVLHRDIQDVHAGYIHFMNALSMRAVGEELVSMRYPLVFLTLVQACFAYWIFSRNSVRSALLVGGVLAGLTFVQFQNPTANWYCLFLVIVLAAVLSGSQALSARRIAAVGALVGAVFMFRQLTGVIVAAGTVVFVLTRLADEENSRDRCAVLCLLIPAFLVLAVVVAQTSDLMTILLIGAWPLVLTGMHVARLRASNALVWRFAAIATAGAVFATAPIFIYHGLNQSIGAWWNDAILVAVSLSGQDFISTISYSEYPFLVFEGLVHEFDAAALVNGIFWLALLSAPAVLGVELLRRHCRAGHWRAPAFAYLACFYSLVALHYQIPIYLMYSSALTLAGLLVVSRDWSIRSNVGLHAVVACCLVVGLMFHAGKPLPENISGVLRGDRGDPLVDCDLPRLGVDLQLRTCEAYKDIIALVDQHAAATESVLTLPANPEINFLSNRRSPLWFYNSALGIRSNSQLDKARSFIDAARPALIFYNPSDKYVTEHTRQLVKYIEEKYRLGGRMHGLTVYLRLDTDNVVTE